MIRNENEYREAVARLTEEKGRIKAQRAELKKMGLTATEIKRATDPIFSSHLQLEEEVQSYERLKRGEFDELSDLRGLGHSADFIARGSGTDTTRAGGAAWSA